MTYNSHEEAQNALDTIHETHTFPGMDVAMVLKWVDQDLQKRRKMGPDAVGGPMYGESQAFSDSDSSMYSHQPFTLESRPFEKLPGSANVFWSVSFLYL